MLATNKETAQLHSINMYPDYKGCHHGQSQRKDKFTVAVEGNIGSGKSTLLKYFSSDPSVQVLAEPVALWKDVRGHNTLDLMYKDAYRWSLAFQSYVQLTMLDHHCAQDKGCRVKLMERSVYSARYCFVENLYQGGLFPPVDYAVLDEWFQWIRENVNIDLDLIVYLRSSPAVCKERIRVRNNEEEAGVPLQYLESLHKLHDDWLMKDSGFPHPCPILVLDADCELDQLQKELDRRRHEIVPQDLS